MVGSWVSPSIADWYCCSPPDSADAPCDDCVIPDTRAGRLSAESIVESISWSTPPTYAFVPSASASAPSASLRAPAGSSSVSEAIVPRPSASFRVPVYSSLAPSEASPSPSASASVPSANWAVPSSRVTNCSPRSLKPM